MKENKQANYFKKSIDVLMNNEALLIILKYGIFGILWIFLSDFILELFTGDFEIYKNLQTYKGWLFILITMVVVYMLVYSREKRIKEASCECLNVLDELEHIAYYDMLTGLPNRAKFISLAKDLASKPDENFAIALLNIDNFKYVNDTLGHFSGDDFLKFIGDKLLKEVKAPNMVARLGGDEFAILFEDFKSKELLLDNLEIVKNIIGKYWNSGTWEFFISVSIGVAIYPNDGNSYEILMKNSNIAMHTAKKDGKDKILFYEDGIHEETLYHIKMANKLQKGLDNYEFELYYQPQMELMSGKIIGAEVLLRWFHLNEEQVSPAVFIPVAELTGQIYELERRIIRNVLIQKKKWEETGLRNIELSINLSSKSLISDPNFKKIEAIFSEYDLDYSNIIIEITETAAISSIDTAIERLNILKEKGLKIALDDFGTGFSSITHLMMLPIDIIKLDKSYINSKYSGSRDISIVKFIVSLVQDLGFKVVAEGIETMEQFEYLKSINCEYGQGYFIGKPMKLSEINEILNKKLNLPLIDK